MRANTICLWLLAMLAFLLSMGGVLAAIPTTDHLSSCGSFPQETFVKVDKDHLTITGPIDCSMGTKVSGDDSLGSGATPLTVLCTQVLLPPATY